MLASKINDVLETKTPEEVKLFLDQFAKGLDELGCQKSSVKLLCNPRAPWAKCVKCDKAFTIDEICDAKSCPDCGQTEEFEMPVSEEYAEKREREKEG